MARIHIHQPHKLTFMAVLDPSRLSDIIRQMSRGSDIKYKYTLCPRAQSGYCPVVCRDKVREGHQSLTTSQEVLSEVGDPESIPECLRPNAWFSRDEFRIPKLKSQ